MRKQKNIANLKVFATVTNLAFQEVAHAFGATTQLDMEKTIKYRANQKPTYSHMRYK